jgi:hypothetical protein
VSVEFDSVVAAWVGVDAVDAVDAGVARPSLHATALAVNAIPNQNFMRSLAIQKKGAAALEIRRNLLIRAYARTLLR